MRKTFRLFLSSTFGDFQFEREALKDRVWGELEAYCAARGASFEVVDLRWGISESDGLAHDTVRICLDEIAHCQKLSPKPNFLMLLGDRYGWRPLPPEIPADEYDQIIAALDEATAADAKLLKDWYRRDDNAVPAQHVLRPRGDAHRAYADWQPIEDQLLRILRASATRLGRTPFRNEHYFYSATHQEIVRGALAVGDADQHVFACIRDLQTLDPQTPPARRFTDFDAHGHVDAEAAQLRQALRSQVEACLPPQNRFNYTAHWQSEATPPISTAHLEQLCTDILSSLRRVIDQELDAATGDTLDQEIATHRDIGADRARLFIGRAIQRTQLAQAVQAILTSSDETPGVPQSVLIHGPGGAGKSAFMARVLADIKQQHPDAVVMERFIGTTPRSIDLATFLRDLLTELARRYGQDETLPEGDLKELIEALSERLAWATADKPLLLVIDALDQFNDSFHARQHQWLPKELPPHVAIVLSVLDGPMVASLQQRHPKARSIPLPAFTAEEGEAMLDALLAQGSDRQRCLTPTQKAMVLDAFQGDGRPLYLALAANACRRWRSWDKPEPLPDRLEALIRDFVDELKDTHGPRIADRALDYLCAVRFGVSDQEMRDLLWNDSEAKAEFEQRKNPDQPEVDSLPTVIWSRLYFDLAPYLAEQGTTGALLYRFYHRIIGEEIATYTLADDAQIVHTRIADYFQAQPLHLHTHDSQTPNRRKLSEEPWQRNQAKQLDKAEQLLTDFNFVMAKCEADQVNDLLQDYRSLIESHRQSEKPISDTLRIWEAFFRERAHILRRGCAEWPAHKILLQLAAEHADDSPITIQAELWLAQGNCDWVWLRNIERPARIGMKACIAVLEGHTGSIDGAMVLPDGRILSWSSDGTLRFWDSANGKELIVLERRTGSINGVQRLPDGRILSWSSDGTLCFWDSASGREIAVLAGHKEGVHDVELLPDGRLMSLSGDSVRLWDSLRGQLLVVIEGHREAIIGAKILPDGRILSWSRDKTLRLWDGQSGKFLVAMEGHCGDIDGIQVLPDNRILSWSRWRTPYLWDNQSGQPFSVPEGHTGPITGVHVLSDGRILSWSRDGTLRLWEGRSGKPLIVMEGHTKEIVSAEVLPGDRILSWSGDQTLGLWNGQSGQLLALLGDRSDEIVGVQVLGGRILSWSWNPRSWSQMLRLWDGQSGKPLAAIKGHDGHAKRIMGVQMLANGGILSWSQDGVIALWNEQSGKLLTTMGGQAGAIRGVKVLPGDRIVSWSSDKKLRLWDGLSGQLMAAMEGHTEGIVGVQVLTNGHILSWSSDKTLRLWDGQNGHLLAAMEGHTEGIVGVQVLTNGHILSWSSDKTLRLWDGQNGQLLATMAGHKKDIKGVRLLPNGYILSWSGSKSLLLWSGQNGESLTVIEGHLGEIKGAEVLPDSRIVSWASDRTLRLWDGQSGKLQALLRGHSDSIEGVRVLSDGRILSWSWDKSLRLWDGQSGQLLALLGGHAEETIGVRVLLDGRILSWSRISRSFLDGPLHMLRIWNSQRDMPMAEMEGHMDSINGAQQLPDGRILSWSSDGTLRFWDSASGGEIAVLAGHKGEVHDAQLLPDGRLLSRSEDGVRIWDSQNGQLLVVIEENMELIKGVKVLPNGRILSWSRDKTLRLWDGQSGNFLVAMEGHCGDIDGIQILPDNRVLSWSSDKTLRLWDGQTGHRPNVAVEQKEQPSEGTQETPELTQPDTSLEFSGNEETLAIREMDHEDQHGSFELTNGNRVTWFHDFSDGSRLIRPRIGKVVSEYEARYSLKIWDRHAPFSESLVAVLEGHTGFVSGATALSCDRILSWSRNDETLRMWDGQSGQLLALLVGHTAGIRGAMALPDGRILSLSKDGTIRLWEGQSGSPLAILDGNMSGITSAFILPNGKLLGCLGKDTLRLWTSEGSLIATVGTIAGALTIASSSSIGIDTATMFEHRVHWATWYPESTYACWCDDNLNPIGRTRVTECGTIQARTKVGTLVRLRSMQGASPLSPS